MPRSLWTGSVSFGLVNVPVQLVSAVRDVDLHFHQLHEEDGARVEQRRFCAEEDREVPFEEIGRAFDLDGEQVVLTDDELASVAPRRTRTIDIASFVDLADVDPIFFDHPYFLVPAGDSEGAHRAYRLLVEVLGQTERAALGRFVLRAKEHLAILQVREDRLAITTMRFADEVRDRGEVEDEVPSKKPTKGQLDTAVKLVESLAAGWDPTAYEDRYRARLQAVVDDRKKGKTVKAPEADDEPAPADDLLAALKRSLDEVRGGGGSASDDGGDDLEDLSKDELYERAQAEDVPGRSSMSKKELVAALKG